MKVDWTDKKGDSAALVNELQSVSEDAAGRAYLLFERQYPSRDYGSGSRSVIAMQELHDGAAVFAHGQEYPALCYGTFSHYFGGFAFGIAAGSDTASPRHTRYYTASWSAPLSLRVIGPDVSFADARGSLGAFSMNAAALFALTVATDGRVIVDTSNGALRFPADGSGRLSVGTLVPTSNGAIARRFLVGDLAWVYVRNDATFDTLLNSEQPGIRYVTGAAIDHSAGDAIVWAESKGIGGSATESVLFTSPFAEAAANVVSAA